VEGHPTLRRTKRPPHGFGRLKTTAFTESYLQQKKDLTTKKEIVDNFGEEEEKSRVLLKAIPGQRRSVANEVSCIT